MNNLPSGVITAWERLTNFLFFIARHFMYDLTWYVGPVVISLVADFKVVGPNRLPKKGGVLFTANHMSQWDLVVIFNIIPRPLFTLAKVEFFEIFFVGGLVRFLGAFPVNRGKADRPALAKAIRLLREGNLLGIFPEGHRSDTFSLIKAHNGAALIALQAKVPLIPVAITGTEFISRKKDWKKGRLPISFLNRPRVTVRIGEPYYLPEPKPGQKQDLDELTDLIMGKVAELLPEEYQGEYSPAKISQRKAAREIKTREREDRKNKKTKLIEGS